MKKIPGTIFVLALSFLISYPCAASGNLNEGHHAEVGNPLEGRWDLTIDVDGKPSPSWLEISHSGTRAYVGRFVGIGGSARPISQIRIEGDKFSFAIPPQWERGDGNFTLEGQLTGDQLSGTIVTSEGKQHNWTGKRAPVLQNNITPVWGKPIKLFNGKNLTGWHPTGASNQWVAEGGTLKSPHSGVNLVTDQKFKDFKLHIEFKYQKGSNSGIYLRGRHEVQIQDDKGQEPSDILFGAIYGFLTPNEMAAKASGEWQTFEITLIGRKVTIVANGKKIICDQLIPGITGGALDSDEGAPGPIYLQGDHGPIAFRNIIVTPVTSSARLNQFRVERISDAGQQGMALRN